MKVSELVGKPKTWKAKRENHSYTVIVAIITLIGVVLSSFINWSITRVEQTARELADQNSRFGSAIEHLANDSLAIRMGGLFELRQLGLESDNMQEIIVQILGPFIREGIENPDLLLLPRTEYDLPRPNEDVLLACQIVSLFWAKSGFSLSLRNLQAQGINLAGIQLRGANLTSADFQGAILERGDFQGTNFSLADFQGTILTFANFRDADLVFAIHLTAEQLRDSHLDGNTLLCYALRAERNYLRGGRPDDISFDFGNP